MNYNNINELFPHNISNKSNYQNPYTHKGKCNYDLCENLINRQIYLINYLNNGSVPELTQSKKKIIVANNAPVSSILYAPQKSNFPIIPLMPVAPTQEEVLSYDVQDNDINSQIYRRDRTISIPDSGDEEVSIDSLEIENENEIKCNNCNNKSDNLVKLNV